MPPASLRPLACLVLACLLTTTTRAADPAPAPANVDPLSLSFHRQAVRRSVFSQEIPFGRMLPGEIVNLSAMHPPAPAPKASLCDYRLPGNGTLEATAQAAPANSALYVSGVNPYAAYRVDVVSLSPGAEVAIEFGTLDRATRVQVAAASGGSVPATVRVFKDGQPVREFPLGTANVPALEPPYRLCVQLAGVSVAAFAVKDGQTRFLGRLPIKERFGNTIDLRDRATMARTGFHVATRLPAGGRAVLGEAAGSLSAGMGQADIRQITHADGAPFIEDGRFWFTFSSRGMDIDTSCQGVLSLDPSVFDPRLEGIVVFDRGDGILRNDYASHIFYDDDAREWRALTCCFSASPDGRGPTGLAFARSARDPRRGFTVMSETQVTAAQIPGRHEDPCLLHDPDTGKWRLLTSAFEKGGIRAAMYESDRWDGTYRRVAGPVEYDSTGTLIQKIGGKRYVFSGCVKGPGGAGAVLAYTYPDLKLLGEMKFDLPVTKSGGRIWPGVFPLPTGYPARYMALTMDRANFPDPGGPPQWSYGALYLYWADTPDLNAPYEFSPAATAADATSGTGTRTP